MVWRELLARYGVNDVASLVFRDRFGCWAFLELWRSESGSRFINAEAEFLTEIAGPVTEALRRCQARAFDMASSAEHRTGPVVLVLSAELEVRAQTPETERYLGVLVPPDVGRHPIPAGAYDVAAQLLAVESGVDDHPPSARVHLAGEWVTLRAARIGETAPTDARDIAVTIEASSAAERLALHVRAPVGSAPARRSCSRISQRVLTPATSGRGCSSPSTLSKTTSSRSSPRPGHATVGLC